MKSNVFLVLVLGLLISIGTSPAFAYSEECIDIMGSNFPNLSETASKTVCGLVALDLVTNNAETKQVSRLENRIGKIVKYYEEKNNSKQLKSNEASRADRHNISETSGSSSQSFLAPDGDALTDPRDLELDFGKGS